MKNHLAEKRFLGLSRNFWVELKVMLILIIIALTIKATLVEIYVVPTGSMEDTILTGDMLIGNKFIYGMRTPTRVGLIWTRLGFDIPWFRLPKFKELASGDVTIFEFPRDPFQKYVKRCIGTAGDSVSIKGGDIFVNNRKMQFPQNAKYVKGTIYPPDKEQNLYSYFHGNQDNIAPFVVPFKGMEIDFSKISDWASIITLLVQDGNHVTLGDKVFTVIDAHEMGRMKGFLKYKLLGLLSGSKAEIQRKQRMDQQQYIQQLIEKNRAHNIYNPWEIRFRKEDYDLVYDNLKINGRNISDLETYTFQHNFYFFMGDNRDNSFDSRFWGFVPDTQILGTPVLDLLNLYKFKLRFKTTF
ncbi:MAG: signal peptidase I [FCB group bacterium]|nr:signal peptidase I [FCB group bacterium]